MVTCDACKGEGKVRTNREKLFAFKLPKPSYRLKGILSLPFFLILFPLIGKMLAKYISWLGNFDTNSGALLGFVVIASTVIAFISGLIVMINMWDYH